MRGHWLSGTRKLNRHYQSGGGGGMFTPSDLLGCPFYWISGFQFGYIPYDNYSYDGYHDYAHTQWGTWDLGTHFYDDDPMYNNIIVAPFYSLGNVNNLQRQNVETRDAILWDDYGNTSGQTVTGSQEVWTYGDVGGNPQWFYQSRTMSGTTGEAMYWATHTYTSYDSNTQYGYINQNGIDNRIYTDRSWLVSTGVYSKNLTGTARTPYPFETAYSGKMVDVIIPIYELVAIRPPRMQLPLNIYSQYAITFTSETPQNVNLQPYIRLDRDFDRQTIHTVPAMGIPIYNNVYSVNCKSLLINNEMFVAVVPGTTINCYELGTLIGNDQRTFEYMIYLNASNQPDFIVMGQNGAGYNMCLARRIKYLKHLSIQIDQYINNNVL